MNLRKIFITMFSLDLRSLAVMRILISLIILWDLCATRSRFLTLFYTDEGALPRKALLDSFANNPHVSLHMMAGSTSGEVILLLLAGFFALNVLIGYRTRLFTFLSWLMLMSIDNRNPFSISEDFYLLIILFWAMFLPWGNCLSVDSLNKRNGEESAHRVSSLASAAFIIQIVSFYISVGVMKHLSGIWNNGHALYMALMAMGTDNPLVGLLLDYPNFLSLMTKIILYMEMIVPLFFLAPFFNYALRTAAIGYFIFFHIMVWLTLAVGYLSPISIAVLVGLIPSIVWDENPGVLVGIDRLVHFLKQKLHLTASSIEPHPLVKHVARKAVSLCIIFFTLCNLDTAFCNMGMKMTMPNRLHFLLRSIYLDHHWNMFSRLSGYRQSYVFEDKFGSGDKVDILDEKFFKEVPVQKFLANGNPRFYGPYWGNYLCRETAHLQEAMKLKQVRLIETLVPIRPYNKGPERKAIVFTYQCP